MVKARCYSFPELFISFKHHLNLIAGPDRKLLCFEIF